ncbi:MAG: 3-oxoacyl-ACP reductase, partial [Alphaproteobacteria bacterium]
MNAQDKPGAPPLGKFVDAGDGVTVHLHDLGDDANPAVVFVHGSGPGASGWSNFKQNVDAFV